MGKGMRGVVVGALGAAVAAGAAVPAGAAVGRPDTVRDEVRGYFAEGVGRQAGRREFRRHLAAIARDCKKGVLASGVRVLDSHEAHAKHTTTEAFVRALYRSLLNRDADPGGLAAYTAATQTRGWRWAVTDVQASSEFQQRLAVLCAGRRSSGGTVVNGEQAVQTAIRITEAAARPVRACGVRKAVVLVGPGRIASAAQAPGAIKAARAAVARKARHDRACRDTFVLLSAADQLASLGGAGLPAYALLDTARVRTHGGRWCVVRTEAGPSAAELTERGVRFRC